MSKSDLIKIQARALNQPRRCRAGHCFGTEFSTAEVTPADLAKIKADSCLEVKEAVIAGSDPQSPANDELGIAEKVEILAKAMIEAGLTDSPNVKEAGKLVDFKVDGALRDTAWETVQADKTGNEED